MAFQTGFVQFGQYTSAVLYSVCHALDEETRMCMDYGWISSLGGAANIDGKEFVMNAKTIYFNDGDLSVIVQAWLDDETVLTAIKQPGLPDFEIEAFKPGLWTNWIFEAFVPEYEGWGKTLQKFGILA